MFIYRYLLIGAAVTTFAILNAMKKGGVDFVNENLFGSFGGVLGIAVAIALWPVIVILAINKATKK